MLMDVVLIVDELTFLRVIICCDHTRRSLGEQLLDAIVASNSVSQTWLRISLIGIISSLYTFSSLH